MTSSDSEAATPRPHWKPLEATQRRVLGVLIEKAKTTPAAYPMTINAMVTGSNQKNNREPLTQLDDTDVAAALRGLETLGVVSEIDWMGRSSKFKHHAYEWLGVNKPELAVMTELLLRGEQTLGDLRARAARMEPIADLTELKPIVDGLLARGLMLELTPPGRGQIVSHALYLEPELAALRARLSGHAPREASVATYHQDRAAPSTAASTEEASTLAAEVAELREEISALRSRVEQLESRLDESSS